MSQDDNNNQEKKPGKFTFNSYWIYGSIILGLIVFNLMFLSEASTEVINFQRFAQLVEAGDVAKIEVVNKKEEVSFAWPFRSQDAFPNHSKPKSKLSTTPPPRGFQSMPKGSPTHPSNAYTFVYK